MYNNVENNHILIVDDNEIFHSNLKRILIKKDSKNKNFKKIEKKYTIDCALQGIDAIQLVEKSIKKNQQYALAFIDENMPPGIDGLETIKKIWEIDPFIEIVLCSAYLDYSLEEIIDKVGLTDHLLILKKPFESIEVQQITLTLLKKWNLSQDKRNYEDDLRKKISENVSNIKLMFDFANKLNSLATLDEIYDFIIETTKNTLKCSRISIMLVDETKKYLIIKKSIGLPDFIKLNTKIEIKSNFAGQVYMSSTPLISNDLKKDGYFMDYSDYDAAISSPFIFTPLSGYKVKLGVINVTNKEGNKPFSEADINTITYISYTSTIAISNKLNEQRIERNFLDTIKVLVKAIEAKDPYTRGHSERVAFYSLIIAEELKLENEIMKDIEIAGILHDIGKIGIPESILNKPDKLTNEEFEIIKQHPIIGENILKDVDFLKKAREVIVQHHERIDSNGYPYGLNEDQICLEAKILAVADIFDAMNSDRSYRKQVPINVIVDILEKQKGKGLDVNCVDSLISYLIKTGEYNRKTN
jgi:putative nucleotidyltransferase with HDIG domain